MEFEWDETKRQTNLHQHKVDFVRVLAAFSDPERKTVVDDRRDYGEMRFNMLAKVGERVFHVTYTLRGDVIRIISARKANEREQKRYERQ
ncbi:BrnT family toxin [Rhizobium sp. C4]|uniref:BrnT family toxin n=1 Tax=Rhizobium sp. C4 TaxID=1349800 RepID=UPI001E2D6272|nr:BrnT family toxin [Rhizobium sp. C4]MCD2175590.1 BrnT family toxin [Rhizobium sp. C4]